MSDPAGGTAIAGAQVSDQNAYQSTAKICTSDDRGSSSKEKPVPDAAVDVKFSGNMDAEERGTVNEEDADGIKALQTDKPIENLRLLFVHPFGDIERLENIEHVLDKHCIPAPHSCTCGELLPVLGASECSEVDKGSSCYIRSPEPLGAEPLSKKNNSRVESPINRNTLDNCDEFEVGAGGLDGDDFKFLMLGKERKRREKRQCSETSWNRERIKLTLSLGAAISGARTILYT
ncbi:hypothetical protein K438DRAFT_1784688 [Mycena galopus ATCC 62051]|nr:hypothetical protein K438DRAFT_1784688 [Mycena galopus ATCC 62051]